MKKILITGATGNIGREVLDAVCSESVGAEIIAAVRNTERAKDRLSEYPGLAYRSFDFENESSFKEAFADIDILFLLRPPHISQVEKVFGPLLEAALRAGISQVVFLSVQGAEKSKAIPHNKIERLIKALGFDYVFIRPSYFMQNLSTTLLPEILRDKSITLPAGNAKFNWVDVKDIGRVAAELILHFDTHRNKAYEITGSENKSFAEVAKLMSGILGETIVYHGVNPIHFFIRKKKEGVKSGFALVMTMLHFLPRLQPEPRISPDYKKLTEREPGDLKTFIEREKSHFRYT